MFPLQNKHVDVLGECGLESFKGAFVEQVIRARDSIFDEMCQDLNISENTGVRASNLGKRSVTKEKLITWLETVCCILDSYAIPLLELGEPLLERIGKLQEEKISDQESIIKLQSKLIEKSEENFSAVKSTVETEMKSYASATAKNCSAVFHSKRLQAVVKNVNEKSDREKNVVIYGVEEKQDESLTDTVEEILAEIDEKPLLKDICRVGIVRKETIRPIKLTLNSSDHVNEILRKSKRLRTKEGYNSIYICPDRSLEERKAFKKLLDELKKKRKSEPDGVFIIKNNKIVRVQRDSEPVESG